VSARYWLETNGNLDLNTASDLIYRLPFYEVGGRDGAGSRNGESLMSYSDCRSLVPQRPGQATTTICSCQWWH
jgi:hypothetical protein